MYGVDGAVTRTLQKTCFAHVKMGGQKGRRPEVPGGGLLDFCTTPNAVTNLNLTLINITITLLLTLT